MRVRESGMPEEAQWASYFDPGLILDRLGLRPDCRRVLDLGCGYGTFAIPAARRISGKVIAIDSDPDMLAIARERAGDLSNIDFVRRDFVADGCGEPGASIDFVMLFNILHGEDPVALLREARRVLTPDGRVGVIHWRHDPSTPRGPPMEIRPRPEDMVRWAGEAGIDVERAIAHLGPYHYGLVLRSVA